MLRLFFSFHCKLFYRAVSRRNEVGRKMGKWREKLQIREITQNKNKQRADDKVVIFFLLSFYSGELTFYIFFTYSHVWYLQFSAWKWIIWWRELFDSDEKKMKILKFFIYSEVEMKRKCKIFPHRWQECSKISISVSSFFLWRTRTLSALLGPILNLLSKQLFFRNSIHIIITSVNRDFNYVRKCFWHSLEFVWCWR